MTLNREMNKKTLQEQNRLAGMIVTTGQVDFKVAVQLCDTTKKRIMKTISEFIDEGLISGTMGRNLFKNEGSIDALVDRQKKMRESKTLDDSIKEKRIIGRVLTLKQFAYGGIGILLMIFGLVVAMVSGPVFGFFDLGETNAIVARVFIAAGMVFLGSFFILVPRLTLKKEKRSMVVNFQDNIKTWLVQNIKQGNIMDFQEMAQDPIARHSGLTVMVLKRWVLRLIGQGLIQGKITGDKFQFEGDVAKFAEIIASLDDIYRNWSNKTK